MIRRLIQRPTDMYKYPISELNKVIEVEIEIHSMSFLIGRMAAAKEGSYFLQESKQAVSRTIDKNKFKNSVSPPSSSSSQIQSNSSPENTADVLPEVLRHNLPSNIFRPPPESSLSAGSKWNLHSDPNSSIFSSVSPDALNPLRAYVSIPQVTFGPKRWQFPKAHNSFQASTANDSRRDKYSHVTPEKLKAAAAGLSQIAMAFAVATTIVFGGAALIFGLVVSKLELHNGNDIRTKGKDLVKPRFETVKEQVVPLRTWAEGVSKKWHWEKEESIKEKPLIKELSKILGTRTSN